MSDFEVMPVGTRAAMQEAADLFRSYERHHRDSAEEQRRALRASAEQPDSSDAAPSIALRLDKAERNRQAAEKLEALLEQPGVERSGDVFTTKGATIPLGKPMPLRNAMDSGIPGDPPLCGV